MTLEIDTSSAIRTLARQRDLVRAIRDAPSSTQETQCVEWKSEADPEEKRWRAELSRQILGFANRDPDVASKWFGGCAYVVVGVSPGALIGTPVHDAATLEDWLSVYVGRGPKAPDWSATYVPIDDTQVLLLTIEAPQPGSPIWTFQKDFPVKRGEPPLRAGSIYVRQKASTGLASPAEVEMLTRRACSTGKRIGGISLTKRARSRALPLDIGDAATAAWTELQKEALKAPPPRDGTVKVHVVDPRVTEGKTLADAFNALSATAKLSMAETRTIAKYQAEVDAYIKKATKVLPLVLLGSAIDHQMGRIDLALRNDTDHNLHQVEVELYIDVPMVEAYFDDGDVGHPSLPDKPVAYGQGSTYALGGMGAMRFSAMVPPTYPDVSIRRGSIDNSGSTRITFAPVDLYPETTANLDEFYLVVGPMYAGQTISGEWTARARDASGVTRGNIQIEVDANIPTTDQLLAERQDYDDEDERDDY